MLQISNKLMLNHAILLFKRKWHLSLFQLLPSIMFSFLFSQITFITEGNLETKNFIWAYFALSLVLTLLISAVIYFREASIELKSFSYLFVVGYKKRDVNLIVFLKWLFLVLLGFAIAMFIFFLYNFNSFLMFTDKGLLIKLGFGTFLLNFVLLIGIVISIINFNINNGKL